MFLEFDTHYTGLNFVSRERLDPVISAFCQFFEKDLGSGWYLAGQFCVLFYGTYLLMVILRAKGWSRLLCPLALLLGSMFIIGVDPFSLRFHWFPALVSSFLNLLLHGGVVAFIFCLLIAGVWILSSGNLAIFGGLLAFFFALWLAQIVQSDRHFKKEREKRDIRKTYSWTVVPIALAMVIIGVMVIPEYQMPDYPGGARLVPISPLQLYERPLIGPWLEPNPINHQVFTDAVQHISLRFVALAGAILLVGLMAWVRFGRLFSVFLIFTATFFLVSGEWLFTPELSIYAPFPVLARLIPGLALVGLPWLLIPLGLTMGMVLLCRNMSFFGNVLLVLFSLLFLVLAPWSYDDFGYPPRMQNAQTELRDRGDYVEDILSSPSAYVVDSRGAWVAGEGVGRERDFRNLERLNRGVDFEFVVSAEPLFDEAVRAVDGNSATRWRTGRPQVPGDYFEVEFIEPIELVRVVLSIKENPTDFPRGIRVIAGLVPEDLRVFIDQPDWLGPVRWTPQGYPYFGPQSEVILDFPHQRFVKHLKFIQTASSPYFDWSIAEIKLYRFPVMRKPLVGNVEK